MLRIDEEQQKREHDQPTVPTTIGREKATNPFLRIRIPAVASRMLALGRAQSPEPVAIFTALREWKNIYR
jgi:hydroxyacylglutathione hydrolase